VSHECSPLAWLCASDLEELPGVGDAARRADIEGQADIAALFRSVSQGDVHY
jgi:hypothetical protein